MITAATRTAAPAGPAPGAPPSPAAVVSTAPPSVSSTASTASTASTVVPSGPAALLPALRDLPGFAHALITDTGPDGRDRRVVAEVGTDEGTAAAVLGWGRRAAGVAADRDLALDDVIVTTDTAHHLLRAVGSPETGPTGWVYLRVHRDGGNLAQARRRLASLTGSRTPAAPPISPPAATPTGTPTAPSPAARAPVALPAASGPPAPARSPESASPPTRQVPATAPELPGPRRPPAASAMPAVPTRTAEGRPELPKDSAGVLGQRWRSDPDTLRRVLAGLLRLGRAPQTALAGTPNPPRPAPPERPRHGGTHE